jgi:NAD-dependent deacetylase
MTTVQSFIERLSPGRNLISRSQQIVAFSGAGISTESGLADFRSKGGLWDRYRIVTFQEFLASHDNRVEYWSMRKELIPTLLAAKPNAAHSGLAELEKRGPLTTIITQNIDGLHQAAGNQDVIELHGTNLTASCLTCNRQWPIEEIQLRLESGDLDPHCNPCDGLIRTPSLSDNRCRSPLWIAPIWRSPVATC